MSYLTEDPEKWVSFYPQFNSSMYVEKAGYFDERPQVHTSITQLLVLFLLPFLAFQSLWFLLLLPFILFGWGTMYIKLPVHTGINRCENPAWGFNYHDNTAWFYIGGENGVSEGKKWKTIHMPWQLTWVRTSTKLQDGTWFHETLKNRKKWNANDPDGNQYGTYEWLKKNKWQETYLYQDISDGTTVQATVGLRIQEWRPRGMKWTKLFAKIRKSIDIDFDQEVGKEKGSWKGGVLGCSYDLIEDETPLECLRRMNIERKF